MSEELIHCYRSFNHAHHDEYVKEFAGVKETLASLKQDGYDMAVVSNKTKKAVQLGLDRFALSEYFDVVIGCEEMEAPKPDPSSILLACERLYRCLLYTSRCV